MFTSMYFWSYLFAHFFAFIMARQIKRMGVVMNPHLVFIMESVSNAGMFACTVFLIIGFWKMPHWWCPLVALGCSSLSALIPIPDRYAAIAGIILCPVLCVLMYLNLFGVI